MVTNQLNDQNIGPILETLEAGQCLEWKVITDRNSVLSITVLQCTIYIYKVECAGSGVRDPDVARRAVAMQRGRFLFGQF
jgi:hypothetical protein